MAAVTQEATLAAVMVEGAVNKSLNEGKMLDLYFTMFDEISEMFGYKEDWRSFPLSDERKMYWCINSDSVNYCERPSWSYEEGDYYAGVIYTYRHLDKWVYESENHTMVLVNTQTDGNILLMIFDNDKKVDDSNF